MLKLTNFTNTSKSTLKSSLKGVIKATPVPTNFCISIYLKLQNYNIKIDL